MESTLQILSCKNLATTVSFKCRIGRRQGHKSLSPFQTELNILRTSIINHNYKHSLMKIGRASPSRFDVTFYFKLYSTRFDPKVNRAEILIFKTDKTMLQSG